MGVNLMSGIIIGCMSAFFECLIVSRIPALTNIYQNGFRSVWYSKELGVHRKHIKGRDVSLLVSLVTAFFGAAGAGGGVAFAVAPFTAIFVSEPLWMIFRSYRQRKAQITEIYNVTVKPVLRGTSKVTTRPAAKGARCMYQFLRTREERRNKAA